MGKVTLINKTKPSRMLTLNLTTEVAPVRIDRRKQVVDRRGELRHRLTTAVVSGSVRIVAGGQVTDLPESVLKCPEIKSAVEKRWIKVLHQPDPEPIEPTPKKSSRRSRRKKR